MVNVMAEGVSECFREYSQEHLFDFRFGRCPCGVQKCIPRMVRGIVVQHRSYKLDGDGESVNQLSSDWNLIKGQFRKQERKYKNFCCCEDIQRYIPR